MKRIYILIFLGALLSLLAKSWLNLVVFGLVLGGVFVIWGIAELIEIIELALRPNFSSFANSSVYQDSQEPKYKRSAFRKIFAQDNDETDYVDFQDDVTQSESIMNKQIPECFSFFGFTEIPDAKEFKKAYRKFAKENHPDKGGDPKYFEKGTKLYENGVLYLKTT